MPTRLGWANLEATLPALVAAAGADDEIVLVGDGAAPGLPDALARRCRVAANPGPRGFAPTCNRGAAAARGRLLLFLNDDVVVGPGLLEGLEAALAAPGIGAVGPDVVRADAGASESGTSLRWQRGVLESGQGPLRGAGLVEVPYLCGAALAMRRDDFLRLAGFDERLAPYYWEDVDLSLRARARVGAVAVASAVTVRHRHGATIGAEPVRSRRAVYERNRLLVSWRHLAAARWPAHLAWFPLRLAAAIARGHGEAAGFGGALATVAGARRHGARRG